KDENNKWNDFASRINYLQLDAENEKDFTKLSDLAKQKEQEFGERPVIIFYMAVAPQLVPAIVKNLSLLPFCTDTKCTRIVVEKPFGHDLQSAMQMNELLAKYFDEEQIYRIDHYLGKETVQNILALRFANGMFEP